MYGRIQDVTMTGAEQLNKRVTIKEISTSSGLKSSCATGCSEICINVLNSRLQKIDSTLKMGL